MEKERIKEILEKISKVRIAVYGDFCLDAYWHMDPDGSEVSVETGLKAESVARQVYTPGGASNIVSNLSALKPAAIKLVGVIGSDIHGRELLSQLQALGADTSSLTVQEGNFDTYTFTKKYYGEKEDPRIDFGVKNKRSSDTDAEILKNLERVLQEYDALIFNQQVPDSIPNPDFFKEANRLFEIYNDSIVVLDSRHYNSRFKNIYRKVNETEVAVLNDIEVNPHDYISTEDVKQYGVRIYEQFKKPVFVTCGSRGIICFDSTGITEIPGVRLLKKLDTVGAGDTTISALTLCLAAGIPAADSARFANIAAAVTVQKLFTTGTASGEEIMQLCSEADYNYMPELASDLRKAKYFKDSDIEICQPDVLKKPGNIKHVLFDNDGTISTLRQGWEAIMETVMIEAILGKSFEPESNPLYQDVKKQVLEYIDWSRGEQTILQMEGLAKMVDDFNIVPKTKILDSLGYKQIYNEALMKVVRKRLEKLRTGKLAVEDFTIRDSLKFLELLKDNGIILYLASGTDEQDVINEAEALGYAGLFDGGIYGSKNDIKKYSKKMVIERILRDNKLSGNELAVFGDGPVEIKECNKKGGIAIGVASNEVKRFGLNQKKRSRLINSGASIIIPDYSQSLKLFDLLFNT